MTGVREFRDYPCCMCPAVGSNFKSNKCVNCDFTVKFIDNRGWIYYVRSGIGQDTFKTFYCKTIDDYKKGIRQKSCRQFEYNNSFFEAQNELNMYAKEKGWKVLKD